MKKLRATILSAVLLAVACGGDDPAQPLPPGIPEPPDLSRREGVLPFFERVFNTRNIARYDEVLDENFVFYLAPGDVLVGMPEQFGRAEDLLLTSRLFDPNYAGQYRCEEIKVDLQVPDDLVWVEIEPGSAPDERWYVATVFNEYRFEIGPDTYLSKNGARVQLTVRNAGTDVVPAWRLVEWRELDTGESLTGAARVATDTRSWGEIKFLYKI